MPGFPGRHQDWGEITVDHTLNKLLRAKNFQKQNGKNLFNFLSQLKSDVDGGR